MCCQLGLAVLASRPTDFQLCVASMHADFMKEVDRLDVDFGGAVKILVLRFSRSFVRVFSSFFCCLVTAFSAKSEPASTARHTH